MITLNEQNYFSLEAELEYMSNHLWGNFMECEAKTMATLKGEYEQPDRECFKVGHIMEAVIQGRDYTEIEGIYQKNEKLYAWASKAVAMAERAKKDKMFMSMMTGEAQGIYTGEIAGLAWKCKTDCVNHETQAITDLKSTKDFEDDWMVVDGKNKKVAWYHIHGYQRQLLIQRELVEQKTGLEYLTLIAGVTKQDPPDIALVLFDDEDAFGRELFEIELRAERVKAVWKGKEKSIPCGKCDWCRGVKVLTNFEVAESLYK